MGLVFKSQLDRCFWPTLDFDFRSVRIATIPSLGGIIENISIQEVSSCSWYSVVRPPCRRIDEVYTLGVAHLGSLSGCFSRLSHTSDIEFGTVFHWLPCQVLSYLSCSLADRWGTTVDFTTSFLHSLWFSASVVWCSIQGHSLMLSSHRFLCLPLHLLPWTVPCRIVLASPDDHVTCPYHFSLRLFTVVRT